MFTRFRIAFAVAALAACSGASGSGLFAPPAGSDGGAGGQDGAGPKEDGATGDDGQAEKDGGALLDAQRGDAAKFDAAPFACGENDAGAPLACSGGTTCCAFQDPFGLFGTRFSCVGSAADCAQTSDAVLRCHNGSECGGQFCCGDFDGLEYKLVACAPTCNRTDGGLDHIRFCDPDKGGVECNPGEKCSESTAIPTFFRCSVQ
jgi:hypothetical protein